MERCASLGTRATTAKQLRSFTEAKEKDPKVTRKKKECTKTNSAPPRRPRAHGPRRPRGHGPVLCPRDPRVHGPNLPRAHGPYRMDGCDCCLGLLFIHFVPHLQPPIYSIPRPFVRVSKGYDRHMRALLLVPLLPLRERETSPLEIKTSYGEDP